MNTDSIVIRPANPSIDEGLKYSAYMNSASGGGFGKMFGKRLGEIVSNAYCQPNHDMSYETVLFAEADGEIVGMVAGYSAEAYRGFDKDVIDRVAGRSRLRVWLIFLLISRMMRFMHTFADGDFYVAFLAVDETHRGKGIGTRLLGALEKRARSSSATQLALDVERKNKAAQSVYERYGFTTIDHWPKSRIMKPTILRMSKPIEHEE